jgi:hypothetical protein
MPQPQFQRLFTATFLFAPIFIALQAPPESDDARVFLLRIKMKEGVKWKLNTKQNTK